MAAYYVTYITLACTHDIITQYTESSSRHNVFMCSSLLLLLVLLANVPAPSCREIQEIVSWFSVQYLHGFLHLYPWSLLTIIVSFIPIPISLVSYLYLCILSYKASQPMGSYSYLLSLTLSPVPIYLLLYTYGYILIVSQSLLYLQSAIMQEVYSSLCPQQLAILFR